VDARADLFSLGSVLYEAATGKPPFEGKTPLAVLRRVADDTQPSLRQVNPEVPHWLSDVVDRLLEKEPADRIQTAQEVADIFATELARTLPLTAPEVEAHGCGGRTSAYAKPRKKICWKAVVMRALPWLGGIAAGALAVGLWPSDEGPRPLPANQPLHAPETGLPPQVTIEGKAGPVWALAFTPNGQNLAVASENGSLRLWDWRIRDAVRNFPQFEGNVWSVDISPDGRYLAAAVDDSEVKVFDLAQPGSRSFPHPNSVKAVAFSPDGKKLATGDRGSAVRVWDLATQIPTEVRGHRGTVHGLAYCPECKALASAGSDGTVKVWTLDPKGNPGDSPANVLGDESGPVYAVAFSPDGGTLASAGWDGSVRLWDPVRGTKRATLRGHEGDVFAVAYRSDGKVLASAGADGTVRVWDLETGKELHVLRGGGRPYLTLRFSQDGTHLAAGSRDGNVRVWEIK
jgi:tricorn protease-like protein